ncbi:hypothetical protein V2J09_020036 [Rumex salicifolius]
MRIFVWNTQGAGSKGFARACCYLLNRNNADIVALLEPHVSGKNADDVCKRLGYNQNARVEAVGFSGGIWLLWNEENTCIQVLRLNRNFIHARVKGTDNWFHLIIVYGPPTYMRRQVFWEDLEACISEISEPLFVGGDFNCIINLDERSGGSRGLSMDSDVFANLINRLELVDLGFSGARFTWGRGVLSNPNRVAKRLDRFLANIQGMTHWNEAEVRHLTSIASDHKPLYLVLSPNVVVERTARPFRFEAMWLSHHQFMNFLVEKWNRNRNTPEALHELTSDLRQWNKEVFGNLKFRKNKLMARIDGIQVALDNGVADRILELHESLQEELAILLHQEEMHWFQKSRAKWIECGDRNTKFFHTSTMIRRRRKKIVGLKNEVGEWVDDPPVLKEMVIGYLSNIYTLPTDVDPVPVLPRGGFMRLSSNDLMGLSAPFTDIEIWQAVKSMGAYKAPGIDGYQPNGDWEWALFDNYLPAGILMKLSATGVQLVQGLPDSLSWAFSPSGDYTVSSAYKELTAEAGTVPSLLFKLIWRLPVTERIRHFLWLGAKGRLLTNLERQRRHLSDETVCVICNSGDENLIHVFRECNRAKRVWMGFFRRCDNTPTGFFEGLSGEYRMTSRTRQDVLFATTLWWLWKWRNAYIFREERVDVDQCTFLTLQAKELVEISVPNESYKQCYHLY